MVWLHGPNGPQICKASAAPCSGSYSQKLKLLSKRLADCQKIKSNKSAWTSENLFLSKYLEALESNKMKGNLHRLTEQLKEDWRMGTV